MNFLQREITDILFKDKTTSYRKKGRFPFIFLACFKNSCVDDTVVGGLTIADFRHNPMVFLFEDIVIIVRIFLS